MEARGALPPHPWGLKDELARLRLAEAQARAADPANRPAAPAKDRAA